MKRQHKITISFDSQDDDLYFECMRQSSMTLIPVSKLIRHYVRKGMNEKEQRLAAI